MPIIGNFPTGGGNGSGGLTLTAVTDIKTLAAHGKVYVKWTDPDDIIVAGSNLAEWGGTLLVRKAGSAPVSRRDGTIVLDSTTRNAYQSKYFCDSGLTDGITYYYKFFPYTTQKVYTDSLDDEFNMTPNPVLLGNVSGITTAVAGNGKMSVKWTDPAATVVEDGVTLATWASTVLVVKEGSYATSPTDSNAAFTYTSTTRNGHTADPVIATNLTNGKTYYVTLFPMSTDGAANTNAANRTTGVANKFTISATPSQSGSLTYNANSQTPAWLNYNSAQLTMGGVTSGINAGSYEATFTPKADYMWSDGTSTARTVSWKIGRATISATPTTSSSFTYNGYEKTPVWSGYDSTKMTIGGTYSATDAGNYTATFTPTANYQWSDGTVTAKSVSWSIAKATGSLTLSTYAVTLDSSTLSTTVTVTRPGDGAITATSNDTTVATVTVSNNTLTIRHVNQTTGTATITVKVAAGTNYTAPANKTVVVTAQFKPAKKALDETNWDDIREVADDGEAANYWKVGDKKTITISGRVGSYPMDRMSIDVFIIGFEHNASLEGYYRIHFQIGQINNKMVAICDNQYDKEQTYSGGIHMNTLDNNYGGWEDSEMRNTVLGNSKTPTSPLANSFMSMLPGDLRAVMRSVTKFTDNMGGTNNNNLSAVTTTTDYLFLLAEFEVQGKRSLANSHEQEYQAQYEFYRTGNSKIAYRYNATDTPIWYWLRSANYYSYNNFCTVDDEGYDFSRACRYSGGIMPCFAV